MLGKGKGKERFIEVEIKKRKKVNNQRSNNYFVHTILSRIVARACSSRFGNV